MKLKDNQLVPTRVPSQEKWFFHLFQRAKRSHLSVLNDYLEDKKAA